MMRVFVMTFWSLAFAMIAGVFMAFGWSAGERGNWGQLGVSALIVIIAMAGELIAIADLVEWHYA